MKLSRGRLIPPTYQKKTRGSLVFVNKGTRKDMDTWEELQKRKVTKESFI